MVEDWWIEDTAFRPHSALTRPTTPRPGPPTTRTLRTGGPTTGCPIMRTHRSIIRPSAACGAAASLLRGGGMWSRTAVLPSAPRCGGQPSHESPGQAGMKAPRLQTRYNSSPDRDASRPCRDPKRRVTSVSAGQEPFRWAWEDLNLRPHPYQQSSAYRYATLCYCRSLATVRGEVMRCKLPGIGVASQLDGWSG